jgi:hypothetical protein
MTREGLYVYSCHETNIMNLLSVLLTKKEIEDLGFAKVPPFASILSFEFWELKS